MCEYMQRERESEIKKETESACVRVGVCECECGCVREICRRVKKNAKIDPTKNFKA